jgi:hypothetical protein
MSIVEGTRTQVIAAALAGCLLLGAAACSEIENGGPSTADPQSSDTTLPKDNDGPKNPTDCPVESTDDKGNVTIMWVPEGTTFSLFHCEGGKWRWGWFPFDSRLATSDVINVDSEDKVRVDEAVIDGRAGEISVGEVKSILEAAGAPQAMVPDSAVVSKDGKVLYSTQDLSERTAIADLAARAGTEEPTVDFTSAKLGVTVTIKCKLIPPYCTITIRW